MFTHIVFGFPALAILFRACDKNPIALLHNQSLLSRCWLGANVLPFCGAPGSGAPFCWGINTMKIVQ